MLARTWPGLLVVLLLELLLMPFVVLIVGLCAWVEDIEAVLGYFIESRKAAVRGEG